MIMYVMAWRHLVVQLAMDQLSNQLGAKPSLLSKIWIIVDWYQVVAGNAWDFFPV